jgi:rSAM/selenodomain-associated transferase 2
MMLSVLIPTYNEGKRITKLVEHLLRTAAPDTIEILVADASDSNDNTLEALAPYENVTAFRASATSRARQMNEAVAKAKGDIFYFVHADVFPPENWQQSLLQALKDGNDFGMFGVRYDSRNWLLKMNAYFTRNDGLFTGGGDQTLFIRRKVFEEMNGFQDHLVIMEDFDLFWRLRKASFSYTILPERVLVSTRKYDRNSYVKVNLVNGLTFFLFRMGYCQHKLKQFYRWALE